jgi:hypothetical protein
MSRTLVHYSSGGLTSEGLMEATNIQRKLHYNGKPSGLWYAYGDDWKRFVESGKNPLLTVETIPKKYTFDISESAFITDVSAVGALNSILVLSAASFDAFMERFHRPEYIRTPRQIIEHGFRELQSEGGQRNIR